jgi:tRNA threonylcarbamoyl adenosine modification protein (Sua5/YciO/YrdC/YwlC family)
VAVTGERVAEAAAAALRGELVVLPTDTVYGIGTRPDDPTATGRIFEAKRRPRDLELPVLVASAVDARELAAFDEVAEQLAERWWPGALTIVLPRTDASRHWDLGGDGTTIGVRMPAHPLTLGVLEAAGPLAVTSANRSGEAPPSTCDELRRVFGGMVAVYLCEGAPLVGQPSTVLDLAHGAPRLLRRGGVESSEIARALPEGEALLDSRPTS